MLGDRPATESDQERFAHLLPFYITGRLGVEDRAFMEGYVATHEGATAAIQFAEQLRTAVKRIGQDRDSEQTLIQITEKLGAAGRFGFAKRFVRKLFSWWVGFLIVFAILALITKGMYYAAERIGWLKVSVESAAQYKDAHGGFTLRAGANVAAVAIIVEQYGGKVVYSSKMLGVEKVFINVVEKTRLPALIDALMDAGVIEAAAILL